MGSAEEERLAQMVHDFIESSSPEDQSTPPHHCNTFPLANQTKYYNLQEILGRRSKAEGEVLERVSKHIMIIMRNNKDGCNHDHRNIRNYLVMKLKKDGFNASLCHTSWVTSFGCPAGDYEYIEIKDGNGKKRVIVDVEFKPQFEVARPTSFYTQLTDSLPQIFVGTEDKLTQIISLLCSAAKQSLTERGLHVPPWRTAAYMHSKWLSINYSQSHQITHHRNLTTDNNWEWAPPNPLVNNSSNNINNNINNNNKTTGLGGGASALSTQFSNMGINCC